MPHTRCITSTWTHGAASAQLWIARKMGSTQVVTCEYHLHFCHKDRCSSSYKGRPETPHQAYQVNLGPFVTSRSNTLSWECTGLPSTQFQMVNSDVMIVGTLPSRSTFRALPNGFVNTINVFILFCCSAWFEIIFDPIGSLENQTAGAVNKAQGWFRTSSLGFHCLCRRDQDRSYLNYIVVYRTDVFWPRYLLSLLNCCDLSKVSPLQLI